jgi:hypothetical protein
MVTGAQLLIAGPQRVHGLDLDDFGVNVGARQRQQARLGGQDQDLAGERCDQGRLSDAGPTVNKVLRGARFDRVLQAALQHPITSFGDRKPVGPDVSTKIVVLSHARR